MIDLSSDTVTQPTREMRRVMAEAEVGDAGLGEDPTVDRLQEAVCELLGMEGAIFLPSERMANEIAFRVWTKPGDKIILDWLSHPIHSEVSAPILLCGVTIHPVHGDHGVFTEEDVLAALGSIDADLPHAALVAVENTNYLGGGKIWPLGRLKAVSDIAKRWGVHVHMDGSRLMNAVVASGISAREYASEVDSVTLGFTKGLGAPVGAVLAGNNSFIKEARRYQRIIGGIMQQGGIVAAGAIYALQHNVERLAEDHSNAQLLAERLVDEEGIDIDPTEVGSNIVYFRTTNAGMTAKEFTTRLLNYGVRMGHDRNQRVRAVTHLGISRKDIFEAIDAIHRFLIDARLGAAA